MVPCPACQQVAFAAGRCQACGFQVIAGQRAPEEPPPPLPLDALEVIEVEPGGGPTLEGFESTSLVFDPGPSTPDPAAIQYAACPRCAAPQPQPMPALCDACGLRLKPRTRRVEVDAAPADMKYCTECRAANPADRSTCLNCASRLPSED